MTSTILSITSTNISIRIFVVSIHIQVVSGQGLSLVKHLIIGDLARLEQDVVHVGKEPRHQLGPQRNQRLPRAVVRALAGLGVHSQHTAPDLWKQKRRCE